MSSFGPCEMCHKGAECYDCRGYGTAAYEKVTTTAEVENAVANLKRTEQELEAEHEA